MERPRKDHFAPGGKLAAMLEHLKVNTNGRAVVVCDPFDADELFADLFKAFTWLQYTVNKIGYNSMTIKELGHCGVYVLRGNAEPEEVMGTLPSYLVVMDGTEMGNELYGALLMRTLRGHKQMARPDGNYIEWLEKEMHDIDRAGKLNTDMGKEMERGIIGIGGGFGMDRLPDYHLHGTHTGRIAARYKNKEPIDPMIEAGNKLDMFRIKQFSEGMPDLTHIKEAIDVRHELVTWAQGNLMEGGDVPVRFTNRTKTGFDIILPGVPQPITVHIDWGDPDGDKTGTFEKTIMQT